MFEFAVAAGQYHCIKILNLYASCHSEICVIYVYIVPYSFCAHINYSIMKKSCAA